MSDRFLTIMSTGNSGSCNIYFQLLRCKINFHFFCLETASPPLKMMSSTQNINARKLWRKSLNNFEDSHYYLPIECFTSCLKVKLSQINLLICNFLLLQKLSCLVTYDLYDWKIGFLNGLKTGLGNSDTSCGSSVWFLSERSKQGRYDRSATTSVWITNPV